MAASVARRPAEKPRNRSLEARRAARRAKFERERLIVDSLNRSVSVAEIAERLGVTEKRMRALVKDILARRTAAAPEDYAALQASRLNEALLVAMSAMAPENLKAVALVVRIVRELDRYHGFVAAGRRPAADQDRSKPRPRRHVRSRRRRRRNLRRSALRLPPSHRGPRRPPNARKWRRKRLKRQNLRPTRLRSRTRSKPRRGNPLAPCGRTMWGQDLAASR